MFCEKSGTSFSQDVETLHPKFSLFSCLLPSATSCTSCDKRNCFPLKINAEESKVDLSQSHDILTYILRWPNTVFVRAFADAIQHAHKDCKKQTCRQQSDHFIYSTPAVSVLFFSIIERGVLVALVFYHKYMLEKAKMERIQQFSAFSLLPKEPS